MSINEGWTAAAPIDCQTGNTKGAELNTAKFFDGTFHSLDTVISCTVL